MSTSERFLAARIAPSIRKRFLALDTNGWESVDGEEEYFERDDVCTQQVLCPVGGRHPSTFKTLRNARKAAGPDGFVVVFDPRLLPLVAIEATDWRVDDGNALDEEAFAERQLLYWEQELIAIRAKRAGTP